jgi:hypothetical protein
MSVDRTPHRAVAMRIAPELVERLVALVPPPRKNQILYHGISPRLPTGARSWFRDLRHG